MGFNIKQNADGSVSLVNSLTGVEAFKIDNADNIDLTSATSVDIAAGALESGGTAITATAAELNLLDGAVVGNSVASKAAILDSGKALRTNANVGTANTGTTAVEYGDGFNHVSVLTVSTTLPAIAGGANLAVGKLLYTFPAGAILVKASYMNLAITQSEGNITADTPDGGLGTTIASGVVAVLGGTAAFENMLTGQTFNDCNGTAEVIGLATTLFIAPGDNHTVYFNVADGWAAGGDAAAALAGTVVLEWKFLE